MVAPRPPARGPGIRGSGGWEGYRDANFLFYQLVCEARLYLAMAIVAYDYEHQNDDELDLKVGMVLQNIQPVSIIIIILTTNSNKAKQKP